MPLQGLNFPWGLGRQLPEHAHHIVSSNLIAITVQSARSARVGLILRPAMLSDEDDAGDDA
eukprot:7272484-Pyramimonas_sp.AAC.1